MGIELDFSDRMHSPTAKKVIEADSMTACIIQAQFDVDTFRILSESLVFSVLHSIFSFKLASPELVCDCSSYGTEWYTCGMIKEGKPCK